MMPLLLMRFYSCSLHKINSMPRSTIAVSIQQIQHVIASFVEELMYCTPDIRPDLLTIRLSKTPWRNDFFSISVAVPQNFTIHRLSSAGPDRVPKILDPPWVWLADGIYHLLTEFREIWLPCVSVILFQFDHYQWCIIPHCIVPPRSPSPDIRPGTCPRLAPLPKTRSGAHYSPIPPCYWHLVAITGDQFKLPEYHVCSFEDP